MYPVMERSLDQILAELRALMPSLRSRYGIERLWVFGSRADGNARAGSDLDLLAEFSKRDFSLLGFIGIEQTLSDRLGLKVDLVDIEALRPELQPHVRPQAVAV